MVLPRSSTANSVRTPLFDLRAFEFDRGFKGFKQRVNVIWHRMLHRLKLRAKSFVTSFVGIHFFYLTFLCLVLSWILYPQKDMPYIDALFQASSAMALSGLNTVALNQLTTYQQIFLAIFPLLAHPLTTSSALVVYRLHLFKKKFDDIENVSKTQSKMRRAVTYSQWEAKKMREKGTKRTSTDGTLPRFDTNGGQPHISHSRGFHFLKGRRYSSRSLNRPDLDRDDRDDMDLEKIPEDERMSNVKSSEAGRPILDNERNPHSASGRSLSNRSMHHITFQTPDTEEHRPVKFSLDSEDESDAEKSEGDEMFSVKSSSSDNKDEPTLNLRRTSTGTVHYKGYDKTNRYDGNTRYEEYNRDGVKEGERNEYGSSSESSKDERTSSIKSDSGVISRHGDEEPVVAEEPDEPTILETAENDEHGEHDEPEEPGESDNPDEPEESRIRFGHLPKPATNTNIPTQHSSHHNKHHHRNHDPREMFRSLNIMRNLHMSSEVDEDDGPALVIKSPRDIERDEQRGIHSAVYQNEDDTIYHHRPHHSRRVSAASFTPVIKNDSSFNNSHLNRLDKSHSMTTNYLSWAPTIGRNSAFVNLTQEQKEELGGIEYRALRVLRYFIVFHFLVIIAIGFLMTVPWVYARKTYDAQIRERGVTPVLFGMTTVLFAFANNGLCVLPTSLAIFWDTAYLPLVMCFIAMAGGAIVPLMLRFYIWAVLNLCPRFGRTRETLGFLLDHPRRCYLYLFPSTTTWWLALTLFAFHFVEISFFMILNRGSHNPVPYEHADRRFLAAFFQSCMTRTTGLTIIDLTRQHPAMLILNVISMYLAIYPQAMTIRKSNVYEDQSLGRYRPREETRKLSGNREGDDENRGENLEKDEEEEEEEDEEESPSSLVELLRRQFSLDAWSLTLGLFFLTITEGGAISKEKFTLFELIYEVMSAHGTVGFSLGYRDASTSAGFTTLGKLIIIILMIRSAHRGMPYSIDRAVILRGKEMNRRDKEQESRLRNTHVWRPTAVTTGSRLPSINTAFSSLRRRGTMDSAP